MGGIRSWGEVAFLTFLGENFAASPLIQIDAIAALFVQHGYGSGIPIGRFTNCLLDR